MRSSIRSRDLAGDFEDEVFLAPPHDPFAAHVVTMDDACGCSGPSVDRIVDRCDEETPGEGAGEYSP